MKISLRSLVSGAALGALTVGLYTPALAQSNEIVVTALKRETNLQTTATAVSVFGAEDIEEAGITDIQDLQDSVPSLYVGGNGGNESPISLRGISSGLQGPGGDSPVAIYLDGVYIGRPHATMFEFANIERVEVLRGPQGTLYGRNVTGGAINIITSAPSDTFEGHGTVRYGRYNEFLVRGAVSGPLAPGLKLSFAGAMHKDDGFLKNPFDGKRHNQIDSHNVNFGLDWDVSDNLTIKLRGDTAVTNPGADSRPLNDALTGYGPSDYPIGSNVIFTNEDSYERIRMGGLGLTIDVDLGSAGALGDLNLTSITAGRYYDQDQLIDNDQINFRVQRFSFNLDTDQFSQELNLSGDGEVVDWLLGAYYFAENSKGKYGIQSFLAFPPLPSDTDMIPENVVVSGRPKNTSDSWSVFGDATIHLTEALSIGVGARYSYEKKKFSRTGGFALQLSSSPGAMNPAPRQVPILAENPEWDVQDSWNSFTPRASIEYTFNEDLFGYFSFQRGFKSGGYSFSAGGPISNPSFDPEKITAYELGFKADWLDGQLRTNIAGFIYDYSGLQVALSTDPSVRTILNAANADVKGVEFDAQFSPISAPGLRLAAALTYLDATYSEFVIDFSGYPTDEAALGQCPGGEFTPGARTCDLTGNRLPRAPKFSFTASASYDIPVGEALLTPRISYRHEGSLFFTEQNLPEVAHGKVDVLDARLTFQPAEGDWRITAWVQNLTDERYVIQAGSGNIRASFVPGPPFLATGALPAVGQVNRPRTFGVEASFSF